MRFDIYGRFEIELVRENNHWIPYRKGEGLNRKEDSLAIPSDINPDEIRQYLDDIYHEFSQPGDEIIQLD